MITVSLGCAWAAMTLVRSREVLLLSFAVYALFRTFTFNYYFAFLADRLGFRYFGVLAGISFCVAGLVGLFLQAPLLNWAHAPCTTSSSETLVGAECGYGNWHEVDLWKLGTIALLYVLPLRQRIGDIAGNLMWTLSGG
jgi:hypothetical protein